MSITPDQFLTQPTPDDYEDEAPLLGFKPGWGGERTDHLESIAGSLQTIARSFGANADLEDERNTLREAAADLEAKYESLFGLVADIEKLVTKSTSKLANSVRDAITGWKAGTTAEEPLAPEIVAASALNVSTYIGPPAHDAPVEEWRAYARSCPNRLDTGVSIDAANRSQIRTMLGMAQTEPQT